MSLSTRAGQTLIFGALMACCVMGCRNKESVPDSQNAELTQATSEPAKVDAQSQPSSESQGASESQAAATGEGEQGGATFDHAPFDALLSAHVNQDAGRVDYKGLKKEEAALDAYLETIASADLDALSQEERFAFLINAYNAYTLKLILQNYPGIKSIRDQKEPWKQESWEVAGETVSLDTIEHERLRPTYKDPRIHFAVNCASIGCPPLRKEAYVASKLDEQLEAAARETLQNERYVKVKGGKLHVTALMDWYGDDFVNPEWEPAAQTLPEFVAKYARDDVKAFIKEKDDKPKVSFLDYDWKLNDAR